MIPKKIHYCWFGRGEKPKLAKKCIASWKKYCPDYEIIEWNEDNFDFKKYPYAKYFLEKEKWAFLSDFVRLVVVYENGGLYYDTDVELIKSPDDLLDSEAFYGFENNENIATGLGFGAEKGNKTVKAMMDIYCKFKKDENGDFPSIVCPALNTKALLQFGVKLDGKKQKIDGAVIYSEEYFNPMSSATGELTKTENTYSIHWYSMSWLPKRLRIRSKITQKFHRIFGEKCFAWLKR